MSLRFRSAVFAVIGAMVLLSSAAFAQDTPAKSGELVFPEVDGWEKGDISRYPTAELGYSYSYTTETGSTVTIYVYNGGLAKIADGIDDVNVKNESKKAENDIKAFGEAGYYKDVKLIKSETITLGGAAGTRTALYSLFSFNVRGTDVDSEIYLFGYKNNFIKIRATRPKGKNGADNAEVNKLLLEIAKLFAA